MKNKSVLAILLFSTKRFFLIDFLNLFSSAFSSLRVITVSFVRKLVNNTYIIKIFIYYMYYIIFEPINIGKEREAKKSKPFVLGDYR